MTALYDSLRAANLAVSLLLAAAMLARGAAFLRAPVASKYGRLALFAWVSWYGWGTVEVLIEHVPAGPRVPGGTAVLLVTAVYVWAELHYDRQERIRVAQIIAQATPAPPLPSQRAASLR